MDTIDSVISQTYENWELILVDDGSTDGTEEIIRPYLENPKIKFYLRPNDRPSGGNAARNYGYEKARGEFIKWLDSDDLLLKDCIKNQINVIREDNLDVVFALSQYFVQDINEKIIVKGELWHPAYILNSNILDDFIYGKIRFSNNDGLWRKEVLGIKPYNENLKNSQEYLMIISMLAKKIRVSMCDEVLILIRKHDNRMPSTRSYDIYSYNQILARYHVIKELRVNEINNNKIYRYLIKSMFYYYFTQLKKFNFKNSFSNMKLIINSIRLSY